MTKKPLQKPMQVILLFYSACYLLRLVEYLMLRTDQTVFGEAFLHKLAGILLLAAAVKWSGGTMEGIGFSRRRVGMLTACGLGLGVACYILAYGVEWQLLRLGGNNPSMEWYVSSYAVDGNRGNQTALVFFLICIAGNILNVLMEEGVFRGFFLKLAQRKLPFWEAATLSSLLFGLWHLAGPLRSALDGEMSPMGAALSALTLAVTSALFGLKLCLLVRMTGSLWLGMVDHFFNNAIVNLLHVVTAAGADQLMTVRISVAQAVSLLLVLAAYWRWKRDGNERENV